MKKYIIRCGTYNTNGTAIRYYYYKLNTDKLLDSKYFERGLRPGNWVPYNIDSPCPNDATQLPLKIAKMYLYDFKKHAKSLWQVNKPEIIPA